MMSVMFDPETAIYPFPPKPVPLSADEKAFYREKIKRLLKERDAVMVAHYYTDPEIQQLAEETGGCISDSLEMARFGANHPASTLLVAGVRFMGRRLKFSARKNHFNADPRGGMFAGSWLSDRRIQRVLRCPSGSHRRGLCQYLRGG